MPPSRSSSAARSARHLLLLTDLGTRRGRQLAHELQERLARQAIWKRLTLRHLAETSPSDLTRLEPQGLLYDSRDTERLVKLLRGRTRLPHLALAGAGSLPDVPHCRTDPELSGLLAADLALRKGFFRLLPATHPAGELFEAASRILELSSSDSVPENAPSCLIAEVAAEVASWRGRHETPSTQPALSGDAAPIELLGHAAIGRHVTRLCRVALGHLRPEEPLQAGTSLLVPPAAPDAKTLATFPVSQAAAELESVSICIEKRLTEDLSVGDVAEACGIPRRTLERRFRDAFGMSLHQDLVRRRVVMAVLALLEPEATPGSAAQAAGWTDTRMFTLNLRKWTGWTPRTLVRRYPERPQSHSEASTARP